MWAFAGAGLGLTLSFPHRLCPPLSLLPWTPHRPPRVWWRLRKTCYTASWSTAGSRPFVIFMILLSSGALVPSWGGGWAGGEERCKQRKGISSYGKQVRNRGRGLC